MIPSEITLGIECTVPVWMNRKLANNASTKRLNYNKQCFTRFCVVFFLGRFQVDSKHSIEKYHLLSNGQ